MRRVNNSLRCKPTTIQIRLFLCLVAGSRRPAVGALLSAPLIRGEGKCRGPQHRNRQINAARQWGEASLRFVAGNAELIEETRETIEIGERLFRKAIMDAADDEAKKIKN